MQEKLTDRAYWATYWKNYKYEKIPGRMVYEDYLSQCHGMKSFIEIGGFPGVNALYFYRHICQDVSLLDFFVDKQIVNRFEEYNQVPLDSIQCIESDFFAFDSRKKYNIVFSSGFIEHFSDTEDVIRRHVDLMADDGRLLIILPNFRGINGWIQWLFDRENLRAHNLGSMVVDRLKQITGELGLKDVVVEYTRRPMVWLEPKPAFINRVFRLPVKLLSYVLKLFPVKGRLLSPYIVITAGK